MRMFNADGSEAEMCGNGVRCVAKYVHDHGIAPKGRVTVETGRGVLTLDLEVEQGKARRVRVDMGPPILRAAEIVHAAAIPILGVNLGHVGFLAEAELNAASAVVDAVVQRQWHVEERFTLDVQVTQAGSVVFSTFALNEVSIEKSAQLRMLDLIVEVDGRPLSRWGCDGVICATPTGSTAYAFSAGGPVVWPEVEALLLVPLSAHALFSRPLVVGPSGWLAIELPPASSAVMWADGRRSCDLSPGSRIEVRRNAQPVLLARLDDAPFTDRLVAKFDLPVNGWRGLGGSRG
jgi:NAD+ kinase